MAGSKLAELFLKHFAAKGSGNVKNATSVSTVSTSFIAGLGVYYNFPPELWIDWFYLLGSLILGFLGFWYREKH